MVPAWCHHGVFMVFSMVYTIENTIGGCLDDAIRAGECCAGSLPGRNASPLGKLAATVIGEPALMVWIGFPWTPAGATSEQVTGTVSLQAR
jgi:hypothetical protein